MSTGGLVVDFGLVMTLILESQEAPQRLRIYLVEHVRPNLRPRTILEVERHIKRIIKAFAGRRLSEISRAEIRVFLQGVGADAPVAANHNLSWFKRLCSWAIEQDLIEVSPAAGIKPLTPKTSRDRVL